MPPPDGLPIIVVYSSTRGSEWETQGFRLSMGLGLGNRNQPSRCLNIFSVVGALTQCVKWNAVESTEEERAGPLKVRDKRGLRLYTLSNTRLWASVRSIVGSAEVPASKD